ncbi:amino acid adenylation domain-containing protein [Micromonospora zamorensis]|uniref:amino acid adenylation domain-containing protein n=1 Tax=Micromonospora zamorensis TaxID=709883 RepID=UPI00369D7D85
MTTQEVTPPRTEQAVRLPLTAGQQRIWFAETFEDAAPAYNVPVAVRLRGPLDEQRLQIALDTLARRHAALRARFAVDHNGEPWQEIGPEAPFDLDVADLTGGTAEAARAAAAEFGWQPLDLANGPLARARLLRLGPDDAVLVFNVHHIVFDDWSTGILLRHLGSAYREGAAWTGPELDYPALIQQENERLAGLDAEKHLGYWADGLAGLRHLAVPTDRPRHRHHRGAGAAVHFDIPADTADGIRALARTSRSSVYMVLLAALQATLSDWSGSPDVAVTSPVATRSVSGSEDVVGYLVNTVVQRVRVAPGSSFTALLADTRRTALHNYAHQDIPFDQVVRRVRPQRTPTGTALFQIGFNYQNAVGETLELPGISVETVTVPRATAKFDLLLDVADEAGAMTAFFEYDSGLFDPAGIEALSEALTRGLTAVAADADVGVDVFAVAPSGALRLLAPLGPVPPRRPVPADFALTAGQQRMWTAHQLRPDSAEHACPLALSLDGPLDRAALTEALTGLVSRHEALRACIVAGTDGRPHWTSSRPAAIVPRYADVRNAADPDAALTDRLADELAHPFDLAAGPLTRVLLVRTGDDRHVLLLSVAHVAADGQSLDVLRGELLHLYRQATGGDGPVLPEPVSFRDFTLARVAEEAEPAAERLDWWRRRLAGAVAPHLPADVPQAAARTGRGAALTVTVPDDTTAALRRLAASSRTTPNVVLLACFSALLSRWAGTPSTCVGTPLADRLHADGETVAGFFVDTVPRPVDLSADPTMRSLVETVRTGDLDTHRHSRGRARSVDGRAVPGCSTEGLLAELRRRGDLPAESPFTVLFDVRHVDRTPVSVAGLTVRDAALPRLSASADLTADLELDADGRLSATIEYATDLFSTAGAERLAARFLAVLEQTAANPDARVSELDGGDTEVLPWDAETPADEPDHPIHILITEQAARTPWATAVVCGEDRLTYTELTERAGNLARRLVALGVRPEQPVAVHLPRGVDAVVALLAVLQSGGAFLPVDPVLPAERKRAFLLDSGTRFAVVDGGLTLPDGVVPVPVTGPDAGAIPLPAMDSQQPAYLIYTSGTSGRPKAVTGLHGMLTRHCWAMAAAYGLTASDRVLQFASHSFDASLEQLLPGLTAGATVVLRPDELWQPEEFPELLRRTAVTVAELPPAYWSAVVNRLGDAPPPDLLRLLVLGGEAVSGDVARRWLAWAPQCRLVNTYGPTEATITATAVDVTPAEAQAEIVGIGGPRYGARVHVLDGALRPVPPGTTGELYIGGCLSRGYLGQPALTAERFLPDPVVPGERMYRSGDLVRVRPDGRLDFLGRADDQVQIRGHRVEPGEVAARLAVAPGVETAAVVDYLAPEPGAERVLVGYVVPEAGHRLDAAALSDFCSATLPSYMVPALFVELDRLPLTTAGKVDRQALPDPRRNGLRGTDRTGPRNDLEQLVADLFAAVLQTDPPGVFDDFFHLGGHSLRATQLVARLRESFDIEFSLTELYATRTVAAVAESVLTALVSDTQEGTA